MKKRLIIFDSDGVLVDSEPLSNGIMTKLLNEAGLKISLEESAKQFTGKSLPTCIKEAESIMGSKLPENFAQTFTNLTFESFKSELKPVRGVIEAISKLQHESCVASSGNHEKLKVTLGTTKLFPLFEGKIFSAHDVKRGKPFPDLFLHAAESMGYSPADCVVIEDSVPGIKAAKAAGMKVLGYSERSPEAALREEGAITFNRMDKLNELIETI